MRVATLDCFAGIAGDMLLGALVDVGVPAAVLEEATAALDIGASLRVERVDRSGIVATKAHVLEDDRLAEAGPEQQTHTHELAGEHTHAHQHDHTHDHGHANKHTHAHQGHSHEHPNDNREHNHEHGAEGHHHPHAHVHGRSLTEIRELIQRAALAQPVKQMAVRAFELLGASEAKIHNVPVERIHFHEVGAVDAIVDIVASCAGLLHLGVDAWFCSPVNTGSGTVYCAHGEYPVPAPATADLLRGVPTYAAHVHRELTTPTGAALLRALAPSFAAPPAMAVERIGYGAGTRNPKGFANVLRLRIGEAADVPLEPGTDIVTVLETAVDDLSPQVIAHVAEQALALGALDAMLTPVQMKKGRPGTLITLLAKAESVSALGELLFRETTTLGIRVREERRVLLDRTFATVATPYGPVRIKTARLAGRQEELNVAPEFEDCKAAALRAGVPLKQVQQAALAAYAELKR